MWRNYLIVMLRRLVHDRAYAAITIGGLALGLAGCLLILTYVNYERSYDRPVVIANLIAWWAMRDWLNSFDARIALGPGPFALAGLLAFAISVATVAGQSFRVARMNPVHALRHE